MGLYMHVYILPSVDILAASAFSKLCIYFFQDSNKGNQEIHYAVQTWFPCQSITMRNVDPLI